jgi:hypothetical protein
MTSTTPVPIGKRASIVDRRVQFDLAVRVRPPAATDSGHATQEATAHAVQPRATATACPAGHAGMVA